VRRHQAGAWALGSEWVPGPRKDGVKTSLLRCSGLSTGLGSLQHLPLLPWEMTRSLSAKEKPWNLW
jgi:hypothetical protein